MLRFLCCPCNWAVWSYWLRCRRACRRQQPLPPPATVAELQTALTHWPRQAVGFRPSPGNLAAMGLPADFCRSTSGGRAN